MKSRILRMLAVRRGVITGHNFHVGPRSVIWAPRRLEIGNDVYVGKNVTIEVDGVIGDGVLIANNVGIIGRTDHDMTHVGSTIRRARWVGTSPGELSSITTIGSDVWIGFGAVILSGVTIGDSAVIAAGSLVTKSVAPNMIVGGSPASEIRSRFDAHSLRMHWESLTRQGVRLVGMGQGAL
jgi:acetyltransferase-like isoleucine patch superfamily enzyme